MFLAIQLYFELIYNSLVRILSTSDHNSDQIKTNQKGGCTSENRY